jgi:hypothetical protein
VIVDAARNKVVAIFDNDTDPTADQATLRYLATGALDRAALPGATDEQANAPTRDRQPSSKTTKKAPSDVQKRLDRLIQQQRDTLRETEKLREEIERSKSP